MSKNNSFRIKSILAIIICALFFFSSAYLYLDYNIFSGIKETDTSIYNIPYSKKQPDDAGILFSFPDDRAYLLFLDFGKEKAFVAIIDEYKKGKTEYFGYDVSYTLNADFDFLAGIIDRLGGIELELFYEKLRYTGIQVIELIALETDTDILMRKIVSAILIKISENGLNNDDLIYITEHTDTNLTIPDCYYWLDYISVMC